jgi:DNA-binding GntR family transcriptional regulator
MQPLASETADVRAYTAITDAVARGDADAAEALARGLVRRGEAAITAVLDAIDKPRRRSER